MAELPVSRNNSPPDVPTVEKSRGQVNLTEPPAAILSDSPSLVISAYSGYAQRNRRLEARSICESVVL